jgi:hypothetical protein
MAYSTINTSSNPLNFSDIYSGTTDNGLTNTAEISNDNADFHCLMIVGNRSQGGTPASLRQVGVWDVLTVNGNLVVTGTSTFTGPLTVPGLTIQSLVTAPAGCVDVVWDPTTGILYQQ